MNSEYYIFYTNAMLDIYDLELQMEYRLKKILLMDQLVALSFSALLGVTISNLFLHSTNISVTILLNCLSIIIMSFLTFKKHKYLDGNLKYLRITLNASSLLFTNNIVYATGGEDCESN